MVWQRFSPWRPLLVRPPHVLPPVLPAEEAGGAEVAAGLPVSLVGVAVLEKTKKHDLLTSVLLHKFLKKTHQDVQGQPEPVGGDEDLRAELAGQRGGGVGFVMLLLLLLLFRRVVHVHQHWRGSALFVFVL